MPDRKLYFVAVAVEAPEHRILYSVDQRDGILMLSEKMARGRSGATSLISEKELRKVTLSADRMTFYGNAEEVTRKLIGAFTSFSRATECYGVMDVRPCDSRWAGFTAEVLGLFKTAPGQRCSFGVVELTV